MKKGKMKGIESNWKVNRVGKEEEEEEKTTLNSRVRQGEYSRNPEKDPRDR